MSTDVRVRFAPSPTGPLHIGGVRTALFNYLFAKKHNGTFILRIEDTDQNRYVEGAEDYIIETLNWCNIPYDEGPGKEGDCGPYRQSDRKNMYRAYAEELVEKDAAYYAFDTAEELAQARIVCEANKETFIYNHNNRLTFTNSLTISAEEVKERLDRGDEYTVRFKPQLKTLNMYDEIRKGIEIDTALLDDKVLFKSDGMPTYHLANVVDDHTMNISHVIRGEEW
ncbi:MAG: glutamyl-tRNA synthetase, partial [Nonlabens sp.]